MVVFVAFAHMGVMLFGNSVKMFGTFVQAFSLNVMYLRSSGAENFIVDSSYQQMLLTVYVIAFCVCMTLFSGLVSSISLFIFCAFLKIYTHAMHNASVTSGTWK